MTKSKALLSFLEAEDYGVDPGQPNTNPEVEDLNPLAVDSVFGELDSVENNINRGINILTKLEKYLGDKRLDPSGDEVEQITKLKAAFEAPMKDLKALMSKVKEMENK